MDQCVITKDLSRLGRNYIEAGAYIEVFFPRHNVRYIAITDGVDCLNWQEMDITPFKNIPNDLYSRDNFQASTSWLDGALPAGKIRRRPHALAEDAAERFSLEPGLYDNVSEAHYAAPVTMAVFPVKSTITPLMREKQAQAYKSGTQLQVMVM